MNHILSGIEKGLSETTKILESQYSSNELKQLARLKVLAVNEIFFYLKDYMAFNEDQRDLVEEYNLWLKRESRKISEKHRIEYFNALVEEKIGKTTLNDLLYSTTKEAIESTMDNFYELTSIRSIRKSLLIDLLAFCSNKKWNSQGSSLYLVEVIASLKPRGLTEEECFQYFMGDIDRKSPNYGNYDRVKSAILDSILITMDNSFSNTRKAFHCYISSKEKFSNVFEGILLDLEGIKL